MKIILSSTNNPYQNIATEEYLLKNFEDDILFLYVNQTCIVCGKHQNLLAEINTSYLAQNPIPLVRRLSGGGTVYHDLGNLNFCFIQNVINDNLVDFNRYISPIVELLSNMAINAEIGIKNDIKIDGKKISGNAEHIWKNRVLHHGTLLYNSNLENLSKVLSENDDQFLSKAVKSNRSQTTNIINFVNEKIDIQIFMQKIAQFFLIKNENNSIYTFTKEDLKKIQTLVDQKYKTWEWTFGYSPKYTYFEIYKSNNIEFQIVIEVEKGIVTKISLDEKMYHDEILAELNKKLLGLKHDEILFS